MEYDSSSSGLEREQHPLLLKDHSLNSVSPSICSSSAPNITTTPQHHNPPQFIPNTTSRQQPINSPYPVPSIPTSRLHPSPTPSAASSFGHKLQTPPYPSSTMVATCLPCHRCSPTAKIIPTSYRLRFHRRRPANPRLSIGQPDTPSRRRRPWLSSIPHLHLTPGLSFCPSSPLGVRASSPRPVR